MVNFGLVIERLGLKHPGSKPWSGPKRKMVCGLGQDVFYSNPDFKGVRVWVGSGCFVFKPSAKRANVVGLVRALRRWTLGF